MTAALWWHSDPHVPGRVRALFDRLGELDWMLPADADPLLVEINERLGWLRAYDADPDHALARYDDATIPFDPRDTWRNQAVNSAAHWVLMGLPLPTFESESAFT